MNVIGQFQDLYLNYGYLMVFLAGILEASPVSWFVPFSFLIVMAGFIAATGDMNIFLIIIIGALGQWISLGFAYYLGKKKTAHLITFLKQEKSAEKAGKILKANKVSLMLTSLVAGITRFWVAYIAGHENYNFREFMVLSGVASIIWVGAVSIAGYVVGILGMEMEQASKGIGIFGWGLIIVIGIVFYKKFKKFES